MPDRYYRAQAILTAADGILADNVTNTFHFRNVGGTDTAAADAADIAAEVAGFYNGNTGNANGDALAKFIGPAISRAASACMVKVTELDDLNPATPEGSPLSVVPFTLGPSGNLGQLPEEVALVATLQTTIGQLNPVEGAGGIRPRARYTGRLYIGPLNQLAFATAGGSGRSVVTAELQEAMRAAANRLHDNLSAAGIQWCVYSRASQAMSNVINVKIDNAFDTQRRRGSRPSGSVLYAL